MPDVSRVIEVLFKGTDHLTSVASRVSAGISDLSAQAGKLNQDISSATAPFASMAEGVLKLDAVLGALAVGGLAYAYNESKRFENSQVELKKVIGDEVDQLDAATKNANALSRAYGESAAEVLASTANFKQAGFTVQESMQLTKDSMDLVIAGSIDAGQASELVVSALKGFRAPASDAARYVDILNEVSNNYATDVEQLGIAMAALSPIAASMGFSMEESAGVLTPVIEVFRNGGEAANALKTGLLRLVDDSKPVQEALASIGVSQYDTNGTLRSGKDILIDVASAFATLDQNQKTYVASQLVGINQAGRMVEVFDNLGKMSDVTATAMKAAGSAALEVAARLETAEVAGDRFAAGFQNAMRAIGDEYRAAAVDAVDGGTAIFNALEDALGEGVLGELFDALEDGLRGIGSYLGDVAEVLPEALGNLDFSEFLSAIGDLKGEIGGLFDGLDLRTPEGLESALQVIVNGISGLINVTTGMVEASGPFVSWLGEMIVYFSSLDSETQKTIGSTTGFLAIINKLTGPIGALIDGLGGIASALNLFAGASLLRAITALGPAGLVGALTAAASGVIAFIGVLAGPAGAIAVIGATGTAVYRAVGAYNSWRQAEDELQSSLKRGVAAAAALSDQYEVISQSTGVAIKDTEHFHQLIAEGVLVADKENHRWIKASESQRDYAEEVRSGIIATERMSGALDGLIDSNGNLVGTVDTVADAVDKETASTIKAAAAFHELKGTTPEAARAMAEMEATAGPVAKELEKVAEISETLHIKMLELATDERIKTMELTAKVQVANIESETERIKSAFESTVSVFENTGKMLGGLFSMFGDDSLSLSEQWSIADQIDQENNRRDRSLDMQEALTSAQVELMTAKVDAVRNGDGLLKVDTTGVEPALELVLWNLLEKAQIRMNESAEDFLLGIA